MAEVEERLDVFDELGKWIGVGSRGAVHREGSWHRCFHLWVVCGDAVLLQRRGRQKTSWPGRLDATAAGHVLAGESVAAAGVREVREELGVDYPPGALVPLGVRPIVDHSGGRVNREFQHVFLVADPRPLTGWTALNREELDGLVRIALSAFTALVHGPGAGPWSAEAWGGERVEAVTVHRDEVLAARYLPALTIMLERFAQGQRPLAI